MGESECLFRTAIEDDRAVPTKHPSTSWGSQQYAARLSQQVIRGDEDDLRPQTA